MATMRELKRRITSVQSSHKITGAMKMISSARFRKAEALLEHIRPYEEQLQTILRHVNEADCDYRSPLRQERRVQRVALVVLASDEGLCGAFNINILKKLTAIVREYRDQGVTSPEVYAIGKKIQGEVRRMPGIVRKSVPELFAGGKYPEAIALLVRQLSDRFVREEIDRVEIIYTHYKSRGTQIVERMPLLPLQPRRQIEQAGPDQTEKLRMYIYEPGCREIFEVLYPLILRTLFYKTLIENQTSEQAVRILAMQMANDNARKLLDTLRLEYNKLRQQSITTELLDMVGGTVNE